METVKKQPLLSGLLILFLTAMIFANIGGNMYDGLLPLYLKELDAEITDIGLFFTLAQIVPLSGARSPASDASRVDLPAPLAPISATSSPL